MAPRYGYEDNVMSRPRPSNFGILDEENKFKAQSLNLLVGPLLGEGAFRRVYELRYTTDLVLKIDYGASLMNVAEWLTWTELQHSEWAKWLAPCQAIDEFTGALVQKRCRPLTEEEWDALKEIPAFLGDATRISNWGWYQEGDQPGRPVMVDYAINNLAGRGLARMKMVKR